MADPLDLRRLALVSCPVAGGTSESVGTGYLIAADLLLTASHVVPENAGAARVRIEADGSWHDALAGAVWRDADLDAVLIRLRQPRQGIDPVEWAEEAVVADEAWRSVGYPKAGVVLEDGRSSWKSVGLGGTLYAGGGGGQGHKQLDLGVTDPPAPELWSGASGAPVLVGGRLAGLVKQVPPNFGGGRLIGVPATALLQSPGFRIEIGERWLAPETLPKAGAWVLVVLCEAEDTGLGQCVDVTLQNDQEAFLKLVDPAFELQSTKARIADAMRSPAHWLSLVRALCLAPIAVFDATDFEPAVMMAMGVRAVVRRGVTITSTARSLSAEGLSRLPFNIKETKLVHHGDAYDLGDERHPHKALAAAIKKGWRESRTQPRYLDLPAYDGVRCPYPAATLDDIGAVERILMLCPFSEDYERNWRVLSYALAQHYARRRPARMLDLSSPRLVGQALYEGIRWSRTCVIDWTDWRPNVFFEFGARLASAPVGPIFLIDAADPAVDTAGSASQRRRLIDLWRPTIYRIPPEQNPGAAAENRRVLEAAFRVHDANASDRAAAVPLTAMPHDATFRVCRESFQWVQEGITIEPQELLRRSVIDPFGPDQQQIGSQPILYADQASFSAALDVSLRERWVAAWYYLANRYPQEQWAADPPLRRRIRDLANQVLLFGARAEDRDPHLQALRQTLYDVIDQIDDLAGPPA